MNEEIQEEISINSLDVLKLEVLKEFSEEGNKNSQFDKKEDELRYRILQRRIKNLKSYIDILKTKYDMPADDVNELLRMWFLYNDLKEINFIGTDLYADALFVRHKVPYLYRSVGRDKESKTNVDNGSTDSEKMGKTIFNECLKQIESGGKGKLYSYSKCFGRMLFKYANIKRGEDETDIEIRKDAFVNCIWNEAGCKSLQTYLHDISKSEEPISIPYFSIDMSNSRDDRVGNLKTWLDDFLGKQEYIKRFKDIYDPIGDAEVVSNHTGMESEMCNRVDRYTLTKEIFCKMVYLYGLKYSETIGKCDHYCVYIQKSLGTIQEPNENRYYSFYKGITDEKCINDKTINETINDILNRICWDNEIKYMTRQKAEKASNGGEIVHIDIYKEDSSEAMSRIWKEIVLEAIRGHYSYTDCSSLK